jgi:peptide/nickel transport system substrate-binding protein
MSREMVSRREFLRVASIGAAGLAVTACQPQTVVIKETVEVEKVVKETVEVEKVVKETVEVEKIVKETVEVEKIIKETVPAPSKLAEAPEWTDLVQQGSLPAVDDRLPTDVEYVVPWEGIGSYGGTWQMVNVGSPLMWWGFGCYELMLRYRMFDFAVVPNVAKSWDEEEGKVFTFHLRKGTKWSDGEPLTADDVMFFYDDMASNEEFSPVFPTWLKAGQERPKVEKLDDFTVRFSYSQPHVTFERYVAHQWFETFWPEHYLKQFHAKYVEKAALGKLLQERKFDNWPALLRNRQGYRDNPEMPLCYAWVPDDIGLETSIYTRNPYYWKTDTDGNQLPYINEIAVTAANSLEAAQMRVFAGENDANLFQVGQFPKDTMILKKNAELGNYHVIDVPIFEPNVFIFGLNLTHKDPVLRELFQDRRFRIALSLAIKREDIRQLIYLGQPKEIRQNAPLRESPFYHHAAAQNYVEFDPDQANALLDEVGLTARDGEGYRLRPDGSPLSITIEVMARRDDFVDSLEMIAEWWSTEVGIKTTVKPEEDSLYSTRVNASEHDAGVSYAGGGFDPVMNADGFIPRQPICWAPLWGLWYQSEGESGMEPPAEVKHQQELYDQVRVTPQQKKQIELFQEILEINAENLYHMGICDRASVPCPVSNRMRNFPDRGWACDWNLGDSGSIHPEQLWIAE